MCYRLCLSIIYASWFAVHNVIYVFAGRTHVDADLRSRSVILCTPVIYLSLWTSSVFIDLCAVRGLAYLLSFQVQKPSSSTLPYCFGWDFDLRKQVIAKRASSIGVCWQTLTCEPGSGPLKTKNGSVVGTRRILKDQGMPRPYWKPEK